MLKHVVPRKGWFESCQRGRVVCHFQSFFRLFAAGYKKKSKRTPWDWSHNGYSDGGFEDIPLVRIRVQRNWIERSVQDAKMACGMKCCQVQGWVGWHHHMATLFMLEQRIVLKEENQTLTHKDIEYHLAEALLRKDVTFEYALELIRPRYKRRETIHVSSAK